MNWIETLQTGDELISAKSNDAAIKHHAVAIRYPNNPVVFVMDNDVDSGVKLQKITQYLKENSLIRINRLFATRLQKMEILKRVKQVIGASYDVFKFNCEHLANYLRFGTPESKQLKKYVFIFLSLIVVIIIACVLIPAERKKAT